MQVRLLMTTTGSVNASITSFSRTIDDYNKLAKQELVPEKQTKAYERVKTFKSELGDYRDRLDRIKQDATEKVCTCESCSRNTTQLWVHGASRFANHKENTANMTTNSKQR
jgi:hypothetical protein